LKKVNHTPYTAAPELCVEIVNNFDNH